MSLTSCLKTVLNEYLILSNRAWNSFISLSLKSPNTFIFVCASFMSMAFCLNDSVMIASIVFFWDSVKPNLDTLSDINVCVDCNTELIIDRLVAVVLTSFSAKTWFIKSANNLPEIAKGAISSISRNWFFSFLSFSFNTTSNSFCFLSSSKLIALPSRINLSCNCIDSVLYCWIWLSTFSRSLSLSLICASMHTTLFCNLSNFALLTVEPALFLNFKRKFSRFRLMSSYFFMPKTSLYAVLKRRFSSNDLTSAMFTIFSASKKKNLAISLDKIKSFIKIS